MMMQEIQKIFVEEYPRAGKTAMVSSGQVELVLDKNTSSSSIVSSSSMVTGEKVQYLLWLQMLVSLKNGVVSVWNFSSICYYL